MTVSAMDRYYGELVIEHLSSYDAFDEETVYAAQDGLAIAQKVLNSETLTDAEHRIFTGLVYAAEG